MEEQSDKSQYNFLNNKMGLRNFQVKCSEIRKIVWHLMENPSSSKFAKLFAFLSIAFIFASITGFKVILTRSATDHHLGLVLGSMPEFQVYLVNSSIRNKNSFKKLYWLLSDCSSMLLTV